MSEKPNMLFLDGEEASDKLKRKSKDSPFMIAGLTALAGVLGYSVYKFKARGDMSTSVYLMHTRVMAQGAVVAALALGVGYAMIDNYFVHPDHTNDKE